VASILVFHSIGSGFSSQSGHQTSWLGFIVASLSEQCVEVIYITKLFIISYFSPLDAVQSLKRRIWLSINKKSRGVLRLAGNLGIKKNPRLHDSKHVLR
jgi:hypothetical protein